MTSKTTNKFSPELVALIGMAMEAMLPYLHLEGSLASSQHPLKYALVIAIAIVMVLGSWMPIWAVNRFRD
ncbi:hypothetical protein IVB27_23620 [Bradyrhizobium sp. 197]|uniref:hypothetical protein n=1 Tax=Bradyrhizobium sp. 197 TaxID=2782663 RepID=UPI001FF75CDB|nr:hypothetical protein [Bradyrhizobium sp. 197]MCK1477712.1 hypothetical protein [Bradyrhizobium sp. 197]